MHYSVLSILLLLLLPACGGSSSGFKREKPLSTVASSDGQAVPEDGKAAAPVLHVPAKEILKKSFKNMTLAEAVEVKDYYDETGYDDVVIRIIPYIIALSQDMHQIAALTLELADIQLEQANYEEAQKAYTSFVTLYLGDEKIRAARYRQLLTAFLGALTPDRDQAATNTTISFAQSYIKDFPNEPEFGKKVHAILRSCYRNLLESELSTAQFYLNKFNYQAQATALDATKARLKYVESEILPAIGRYDRKLDESRADLKEILEVDSTAGEVSAAQRAEQYAAQIERLHNLIDGLEDPWTQTTHPRDTF